MAILTFYIPIDMRTFANYNFNTITATGGGGNTTADHYTWEFNGGFHYDITGTAFSGGFFAPTSGTVTGWDLGFYERLYNAADPFNPIIVDRMYWSFSGLSVPAADFGSAIQSDGATLAAYMPTLLAGDDTIFGSDFDDYLLGFTGMDTIYGNAGNDTLEGGRGADTLEGGSGNDTLNGGQGVDHMTGGLGDDTFIVDRAGETVIEAASAGTDLVKSGVTYVLPANVENLELAGASPIDGTGNSLANVITGSPAANTLSGQGGNDDLRGSGGNDRLLGGTGNDTLKGGAGQDTFVMNTTLNASTNVDQIVDFTAADDTVELASSIFTQLAPGALASANFYAGSSAHDADDRIIYDSATGKIYYDSDGNGPIEQVLFAQVAAGTVVTDADFLII